MAKYRYRIEGGIYGGEVVCGEVENAFTKKYHNKSEQETIDICLQSDDQRYDEFSEGDTTEHEDPEGILSPKKDYNMWECDDFEHICSCYSDSTFNIFQVPKDNSDDYCFENPVFENIDVNVLYSREGALFDTVHEPKQLYEKNKEGDHYVPVLIVHSAEKGDFGCWFVDTDEPFNKQHLAIGIVETNAGDFVDNVFYKKESLDKNYDYSDSTGKAFYASTGWLNTKWHDSYYDFNKEEKLKEYWDDLEEQINETEDQ